MSRIALLLVCLLSSFMVQAAKPKLIVQITVDQLRADLLHRYHKNFVKKRTLKGFNRFLEQGTRYENTHYRYAATVTAAGHATLATGTVPSQHGLISNGWFDRASNSNMYCVADRDTHLLSAEGHSASPVNLTASTFSDELFMATKGKSKIFSVSIKDRGAVLTGGRFGKSFWYHKSTGNFVTSSYFYDETPNWLNEFNESGLKLSYLKKTWSPSLSTDQYHNDSSTEKYQVMPEGFSPGFPHTLPAISSEQYYRLIASTPYGDELTAALAKNIITQQELGTDEITDYLAIGFSVNDYVGHSFGPDSIEAEDNLLRLDQTLANLFYFLDKKIGLEHVLLVLSADHGVDAIPEYKKELGTSARRIDIEPHYQQMRTAVMEHFKTSEDLITAIRGTNLYLDHDIINSNDIDIYKVRHFVANYLKKTNGVAMALTFDQLENGGNDQHPLIRKMYNSFHPKRSGDVVIIRDRSTMFTAYSSATHGSPYRYDSHVPMHFAGWDIKPNAIYRQTSPEDIAVTLSSILGIAQPDKATGKVLTEVIMN